MSIVINNIGLSSFYTHILLRFNSKDFWMYKFEWINFCKKLHFYLRSILVSNYCYCDKNMKSNIYPHWAFNVGQKAKSCIKRRMPKSDHSMSLLQQYFYFTHIFFHFLHTYSIFSVKLIIYFFMINFNYIEDFRIIPILLTCEIRFKIT